MSKAYELTVVYDPNVDGENALDEHIGQLKTVIENAGGSVLKQDVWGKRPLAYEIQKFRNGVYVVFIISGPNTMVQVIERALQINDRVLRYLTVDKDKYAPDFHEGLRGDQADYRGSKRDDSDDDDSDNDDKASTSSDEATA